MIGAVLAVLLALVALLPGPAAGHEVRPAYLEIRERGADRYDVLWKTPTRGDATLRLNVRFPDGCSETSPLVTVNDGSAKVARWSVECAGGLADETVRIEGLERTLVEVIARYEHAGGAAQSARLMGGNTAFRIDEPSTVLGVAWVYGTLGVEHILLGFDHLCFVLALMLLIASIRQLVWTITAFTVAHSITLSAATLGLVFAPSAPIEALIAFSIALVAAEAVALYHGQPSLTSRKPWIVAFAFGLLHGFGFAGALAETGLPADAIPLALLFFNIGVELGQLAFVAGVLSAAWLARRLIGQRLAGIKLAAAYGIGTLAAFWTIERTAAMMA